MRRPCSFTSCHKCLSYVITSHLVQISFRGFFRTHAFPASLTGSLRAWGLFVVKVATALFLAAVLGVWLSGNRLARRRCRCGFRRGRFGLGFRFGSCFLSRFNVVKLSLLCFARGL